MSMTVMMIIRGIGIMFLGGGALGVLDSLSGKDEREAPHLSKWGRLVSPGAIVLMGWSLFHYGAPWAWTGIIVGLVLYGLGARMRTAPSEG